MWLQFHFLRWFGFMEKKKKREESKEKVLKQYGILLLEICMSLVIVSKYPFSTTLPGYF